MVAAKPKKKKSMRRKKLKRRQSVVTLCFVFVLLRDIYIMIPLRTYVTGIENMV